MADDLVALVQGEYDYLLAREGSEFFLALNPYVEALQGRARVRETIDALEAETRARLEAFVAEQNELIEEASAIRAALAERAPEIDNADLDEPDHASPIRWRYDLDSFANFDRLADADHPTGYPVIPRDNEDPEPVSKLLAILRGRFRAAVFGEDAGIEAEPTRGDLDDLGRRIGNLGERQRASLQRYRQEARTLPGMAYARLAYFGSDLVADPAVIEDDDDLERFYDKSFVEWGRPKTIVRQLVNGERLEDWEKRSVAETEATLKNEAGRLNRELLRRLQREPGLTGRVRAFVGRHASEFVVAVVGAIVAGVILAFVFGIGR